jgi:hypothetical protein
MSAWEQWEAELTDADRYEMEALARRLGHGELGAWEQAQQEIFDASDNAPSKRRHGARLGILILALLPMEGLGRIMDLNSRTQVAVKAREV